MEHQAEYIAFATGAQPGKKVVLSCDDPDTIPVYPQVDVQHGRDTGSVPLHQPCPFCGGVAGIVPYVDYGVWKYRIGCDECDTSGGLYPTEVAAWQAWDTRAGGA